MNNGSKGEHSPPDPSPFFKEVNITHYVTSNIYADRIPRAFKGIDREERSSIPLSPEDFIYNPKRATVKSVAGKPIQVSPLLEAALARIATDTVVVTKQYISIYKWNSLKFCSIFGLQQTNVYQYDEDKYIMLIYVDAESG